MFKKKPSDDNVVVPAKNRIADVKKFAWAYIVTALLYQLAGGPPLFAVLFLGSTFFAGLLILQHSERAEQVAIAWVMVLFMLIDAAVLVVSEQTHPLPSENLVIGAWIVQKLWYVFGIALFVPVLLDPVVKKNDDRRYWAIRIAFAVQFVLAVFMFYDKREEHLKPVQCEKIVELMCVPVAKPEPWYTRATLAEDLVFGLQVVLLMAAFSKKEESPVHPE
jgi:hypothetical protein